MSSDPSLAYIFENNRDWSEAKKRADPKYFEKLATQQSPKFMWIGCSDSRVPANQLMKLAPGEVFVHRNISNCVNHTDLNCLSVLHYAIDYLKVEHVIVCGHYLCGGVKAAMDNKQYGLIDNWLRCIKDTYVQHQDEVDRIENFEQKIDKMCELNVIKQVQNVCHTTIVQNAWRRGQPLTVHGWIYDIKDGMLRDLCINVSQYNQVTKIYQVEQQVAESKSLAKHTHESDTLNQQSEAEAAHV